METFGVKTSRMAIASEHGETVIVQAHSNPMLPSIVHNIAIQMGSQRSVASYAMTAALHATFRRRGQ